MGNSHIAASCCGLDAGLAEVVARQQLLRVEDGRQAPPLGLWQRLRKSASAAILNPVISNPLSSWGALSFTQMSGCMSTRRQ